MNERLPDSSGLPLRAMIMVLLFLGVVFVLAGFYALGSSGDDVQSTTTVPSTTSSPTAPEPPPAPAGPEVRVYNLDPEGSAEQIVQQLKDNEFNAILVEPLQLPSVTETTVLYGAGPDDQGAADRVRGVLGIPADVVSLPDQTGVIVAVKG